MFKSILRPLNCTIIKQMAVLAVHTRTYILLWGGDYKKPVKYVKYVEYVSQSLSLTLYILESLKPSKYAILINIYIY